MKANENGFCNLSMDLAHPFFGQMTMNFRKACTLFLDAPKINKPIRETSQFAIV
jgi:hypothetical protein